MTHTEHIVATGSDSLAVTAPYTGEVLARLPRSTGEDVVAAAQRARSLLAEPLEQHRRAEILQRAAGLVAAEREALAVDLASEAAKPMGQALVEVDRCASTLQFSAQAARSLTGESVPMQASAPGAGMVGWTQREPVGVVAAITPFNFPLNLVAHKLGPAVAAGCPVVLKPASATPLSALNLVHLLHRAGLPAGWVQVVLGSGREVGGALVEQPGVDLISFTGSPAVGWGIRARAPRADVALELGNNTPLLVHRDADAADVAARVRLAGFSHAGQSCISTQRILVHEDRAEHFTAALVAAAESLRLGDPLDPATEVSCLIDPGETDRVLSWIDQAVVGGAQLACGGTVTDDGVLRPTVLRDPDPAAAVCSREVFGPVVGVRRFADLREAIAEANDTDYGLQAALFTNDLQAAMAAARDLDFGGVIINEVPTFRADQMPYGGFGESGNTKEGPAWAVRHMTREKLIVLAPGRDQR